MLLRWLPLLVLLFGSCPSAGVVQSESGPSYELACGATGLSTMRDGELLATIPADAPVPYAIVATGPPALVTTCGSSLRPVTYTAGDHPQAYPGALPAVCDPPLVALSPLPDPATGQVAGAILLKPDGTVLWNAPESELLMPGCGMIDTNVAYAVIAHDGDILTPYGRPDLVAVDTTTGHQLWSVDLLARAETVAVELWALDARYGLLSLQYSYEDYEFVSFDRSTGALGQRTDLTGQPATVLVYPGLDEEPSSLELRDGAVEILMFPVNAKAEIRRFDLSTGEMSKAPAGEIPAPRREENAMPVGGSGAPGPAAPPFPQAILPTQTGVEWRIPALVDALHQRVLVVDAAGARWVEIQPQAAP
jgi:hypothetical protein